MREGRAQIVQPAQQQQTQAIRARSESDYRSGAALSPHRRIGSTLHALSLFHGRKYAKIIILKLG